MCQSNPNPLGDQLHFWLVKSQKEINCAFSVVSVSILLLCLQSWDSSVQVVKKIIRKICSQSVEIDWTSSCQKYNLSTCLLHVNMDDTEILFSSFQKELRKSSLKVYREAGYDKLKDSKRKNEELLSSLISMEEKIQNLEASTLFIQNLQAPVRINLQLKDKGMLQGSSGKQFLLCISFIWQFLIHSQPKKDTPWSKIGFFRLTRLNMLFSPTLQAWTV